MKSPLFSLFLFAFFQTAAIAAQPVATVNGVPIPAARLERAVDLAKKLGQVDTPELRGVLVQRLIAEELAWQAARKQKLHLTPEAQAAADEARRASAIAQYLERNVARQEPSEAEVKRYYDQLLAHLGEREYRVRVFHAANREALNQARSGLTGRVESIAGSGVFSGKDSWVSFPMPLTAGNTNGIPLEIAEAIVRLKPGELSSTLPMGKEWVIVRLEEERATRLPEFDKVKDRLRNALRLRNAYSAGQGVAAGLLEGASIESNFTGAR